MSLALIDSDFLPFIACYDKVGKSEKSLDECIAYVDNLIQGIFKDTKCDSYILALTVGKCFRYKLYPEYKGNRKYKQKLNYFKEVKQHLIDNYGAVFNEELEADDIVNICRNHYTQLGIESFIVSPDKDLLMLEGSSYNPKTKEWHSVSKLQAEHYFSTSLIVGDAADNAKGLVGFGKAYAEKTLKFGDPNLLGVVLKSYIDNIHPIDKAIDDFYLSFKTLKVIDSWEGFNIPEPRLVNETKYESEKRMVEE